MRKDRIDLFVPGRLCLFGEHSDWAGQMRKFNAGILPGRALVVCTEEGIYAAAQAYDKLKITSPDKDGNILSAAFGMELPVLRKAAAEGGFFSYVAGVAAYMLNYYNIGGLELDCAKMTLPQKKGLSSSAAVCALTARAFNEIYGLNLTTRGEMEAAYGGEQLTPSRCGRLDQAVAYGKGIIHMTFDGDRLDVSPVKTGAPLHFVFADLNASKDTISILRDLNGAYPYPRSDAHRDLHKLLGEINERTVEAVTEAIKAGDAPRIGALMTEAQNAFDAYAAPLSPEELKSPVLHKTLSDENIRGWTYGGKGVGSQGDGTVQFIAKSARDAESLKRYLRRALGMDAYGVTAPKTSDVRKAVVPLGGYGSRMFPFTKIVKKEFLPVVDTDGLAKPLLVALLESLINGGIEEICLVIRPGDETLYSAMFAPLSDEHSRKLPEQLRRYNENIMSIGAKVRYAYQTEAAGFGHAVLQSRNFSNGEPVLLMLGDCLFKSNTDESCVTQLIDAYGRDNRLSVGLFELSLDETPDYGVAEIKNDRFSLASLIEKPAREYAKERLSYNGKYYGVFLYVITPQVYAELAQGFTELAANGAELPLTPALDAVARKSGAVGVAINGTRYDVGLPEQYRRTVSEYGILRERALAPARGE